MNKLISEMLKPPSHCDYRGFDNRFISLTADRYGMILNPISRQVNLLNRAVGDNHGSA